jgi:hypothetical protein
MIDIYMVVGPEMVSDRCHLVFVLFSHACTTIVRKLQPPVMQGIADRMTRISPAQFLQLNTSLTILRAMSQIATTLT